MTLRTLFASTTTTTKSNSERLVERMRNKAGQDATMLTVRARPQTDPRKPRL
jgi:hypothetical protein